MYCQQQDRRIKKLLIRINKAVIVTLDRLIWA